MRRLMRASLVGLGVLMAVVTACAGKQASDSGTSAPQREETSTAGTQKAVQRLDETTLNAIVARGTLRVVDGGDYSHDLLTRITEIAFGGQVKPDYISYSIPLDVLDQDAADLAMAVVSYPDPDLDQNYHVSLPVFTDGTRLMVPAWAGITKIEDLRGQSVGWSKSGNWDQIRIEHYLSSKKRSIDIKFSEYDSIQSAVDDMDKGNIAAVAAPTTDLTSFVTANSRHMLLAEQYGTWTHNVFILKQNDQLAAAVDKAIQQMTQSGELEQLAKKHGYQP